MDAVDETCLAVRQATKAQVLWSREVEGEVCFRMERYFSQLDEHIFLTTSSPSAGVQFAGKKVLASTSKEPSVNEAISIPSITTVIPPCREIYWQAQGAVDFVMIYFRDDARDKFSASIHDIHYPIALKDMLTGNIAKQITVLLEEDGSGQQAHIAALSSALLYQLCYVLEHRDEYKDTGSLGVRYPAVLEVMSYIHSHLGLPLSVDELASMAGLQQSYFRETFKKVSGYSLHRYVMKARLDKARELLASTGMPISTVAEELGFSSQSHLTTAFKRYYDISPGQFRRLKKSAPPAKPVTPA